MVSVKRKRDVEEGYRGIGVCGGGGEGLELWYLRRYMNKMKARVSRKVNEKENYIWGCFIESSVYLRKGKIEWVV